METKYAYRDEFKEVKELVKAIKNNDLPHIYSRVSNMEGQMKITNKLLFALLSVFCASSVIILSQVL